MNRWALQDAKNRFSAVVDAALAGEPQQVTRRGKPAVVVLSVKQYERILAHPPDNATSFIEHLLAIPKGDDELEFGRLPLAPRPQEL